MTNTANTNMHYAELERLLEVYGSDRSRWPVEARAGAGQLVTRDPAARRLLAEAEALDRVLERAPLPSLAKEAALAERIIAAAHRTPRMVPLGAGEAVPAVLPAVSEVDVERRSAPRPPLRWRSAGSEYTRAAGLMAACLALGVFIGVSSMSQGVLPAIEEVTGVTLTSGNSYALAQVDPLDEELL